MRRKPAPAKKPAPTTGRQTHPGPAGGGSAPPVQARKPPPRQAPPVKKLPAKYTGQPAGGGSAPPAPVKPAAKKKPVKRKLAAPGESCVLDACYAIAGWRPGLDFDDGLFIPDALEVLMRLGLIADLGPADLDSDLSRPGLVLGVDLPGPHAVLVTPGGWWSWGELCDPADFPGALIEEAWQVT